MPQDNTALCGRPPAHHRREDGQALAEYSLILAFVAMACILALAALGVAIAGELGQVAAALP
jgi:Flp pilus assembly pilin Flp